MKKVLAFVVSLALLVSGVAFADGAYVAGVYTAAQNGNNGPVTVEVTFSDSAIEAVAVTEHSETAGICDPAISKIPEKIVAEQSLAVDTVTGATNTSKAILAAVADCVAQAGGDVETLKTKTDDSSALVSKVVEADIVIIGAGGSGLSAALSAMDNGASVIVVEKAAGPGGTTAMSSGLVQVAGTEQQAKAGIVGDSWEIYAADIFAKGGELGNKEIIDTICQGANGMYEWVQTHGITWNPEIQQKHGEDVTYLRTVAPIAPEGFKGALGGVFTMTFAEEAEKMGATILLNTKADELLMEDGKCIGVHAVNAEEGIDYTIKGQAVLVCTGGFAANSVLANEVYPDFDVENSDYRAYAGALGEGMMMAREIGADLVHMQYMKILMSSDGPAVSNKDAIIVNEAGSRFVSENMGTQEMAETFLTQPGDHGFIIFDSRSTTASAEDIQAMIEKGAVAAADTIEELAAAIGVDAETLKAEVENYNKEVAGEAEDAFGRTAFGNTIEEGPFYAAERHVRLHYTMGGIKIDKAARVIDTAGNVIPGLYAAGETTGGVHGNYRVGANALSEILVMGRVAGAEAAKALVK